MQLRVYNIIDGVPLSFELPPIGGESKFICLTIPTGHPVGGNSKPKGTLSITGFTMAVPLLIILVFSMV